MTHKKRIMAFEIIKDFILSWFLGLFIGFVFLCFIIYFDISWRASVSSVIAGMFFILFDVYFHQKRQNKTNSPKR